MTQCNIGHYHANGQGAPCPDECQQLRIKKSRYLPMGVPMRLVRQSDLLGIRAAMSPIKGSDVGLLTFSKIRVARSLIDKALNLDQTLVVTETTQSFGLPATYKIENARR